jgi:1-acyl-sn-glycerol-3-phosphate acyltransferase
MAPRLARFILLLFGWKITGEKPAFLNKYIVVMAPHTSNWDFIIGWLGYAALGIKAHYLIKKEAFFFPLGPIIKGMGAIPIDRGNSTKAIKQVTHLYMKRNELVITITPEGTRRLNKHWKKGFYYMALRSNVPLVLGYLDYKNKLGGLGPVFNVTGDYDADIKIIEDYYRDKSARFPANFNLSPQNNHHT